MSTDVYFWYVVISLTIAICSFLEKDHMQFRFTDANETIIQIYSILGRSL